MTKATMPEPQFAVGTYSAAQMEAYAAARVREALESQAPYGYHIVSEVNGNGIAFCPADQPEAITEFMQAYPGTTIRAVALIPKS